MKERVTLTLEKEIIKKIDQEVDGANIKNRSHAIELILREYLNKDSLKKGVILAGGKNNKALVNVDGKPVVKHIIEMLAKHNITEIYIACGSSRIDEFKHELKDLRVKYVKEDEPLGTAGVLKLVGLNEPFVVCNGDEIKDINIEQMYKFHKEHQALATVALLPSSNPSRYGNAKLEGEKIIEFVEKPDCKDPRLINAGLYILDPKILSYITKRHCTLEKDVFPKIAEKGRLYGYNFSGRWIEV